MNIHLKILDHYSQEHSVTFRYFTDLIDEEFLAIHDGTGNIARRNDGSPIRCRTDNNISIFNTELTSEDDVKNYITKNCPAPVVWFELQEKLHKKELDNSNQILASCSNKTFTFTKEDFNPPTNEVDVEKLLEQLLSSEQTSSNNT